MVEVFTPIPQQRKTRTVYMQSSDDDFINPPNNPDSEETLKRTRDEDNEQTPKRMKKKRVTSPHDWLDPSLQLHVPLVDVDKVRCIIRNIVRDWAPEGQKERDQCYKPILDELDRLFPNRSKERPPCCLVPGAGLGRLALEISCLGFASQGNEFSYYMMICSSFILNHTEVAGEWTIYPWIHSNCNSLSDDDQLRPVSFPDIHPASAGITEGFSMCGGDFVEVYSDESQEASWDVVVTCFFLDTAHNIVEYIEIISKILKDGGVWINLGPLLYHFADTYGPEDEMSIELSLEDVKKIASNYGFELEKEKMIETTYTANPRAMMQNHYFAAFWTMKKKQRT
ncbi:carnosine N-methyltransferase-like [Asparagus officinalis]|uniref:carnosine N-methyltransferase-like n=1 Tax=Asparagus officinalis TaxID=4686 RepID=UPI00098E46CE|nr:carnosine N-methyltransferase-like [Asparagus officinalis]